MAEIEPRYPSRMLGGEYVVCRLGEWDLIASARSPKHYTLRNCYLITHGQAVPMPPELGWEKDNLSPEDQTTLWAVLGLL